MIFREVSQDPFRYRIACHVRVLVLFREQLLSSAGHQVVYVLKNFCQVARENSEFRFTVNSFVLTKGQSRPTKARCLYSAVSYSLLYSCHSSHMLSVHSFACIRLSEQVWLFNVLLYDNKFSSDGVLIQILTRVHRRRGLREVQYEELVLEIYGGWAYPYKWTAQGYDFYNSSTDTTKFASETWGCLL